MSVAVACTPAAPRAKIDACRVDVTGASVNDAAGFDDETYPTEPEIRSYLAFVKGGVDLGKSYEFTASSAGKHEFNSYIFPSAGSWTIELRKVEDDSVLATQAVTAS